MDEHDLKVYRFDEQVVARAEPLRDSRRSRPSAGWIMVTPTFDLSRSGTSIWKAIASPTSTFDAAGG